MSYEKLRTYSIRVVVLVTLVVVVVLFQPARLSAQLSAPAGYDGGGFTAFEQFRSSWDARQGDFLLLDTSIGYNFGRHVGVDVGVPLYRYRDTLISGPHAPWQNQLGDPYADLRVAVNHYTTYLTFALPAVETGSFTTDHFGVDWYNHFEGSISRVTPFVNLGISNGIFQTNLLSQPYRLFQAFRTYGFLGYGEGGASVTLAPRLSVGASYYHFVPSGAEQTFAQNVLVQPNGPITVAEVTHDNGETAYLRLSPTRWLFIEPAYVRSNELRDNGVTLQVGFDFRALWSKQVGLR